MAIDQVDRTIVTTDPATPASPQTVVTDRHLSTTSGATGQDVARRIVIFVFGLIQVMLALRIALLVLDAREANGLVASVLNVSQLFVAPFDGILRTDALHAAGSTLDLTAIAALAGWTVLELVILWALAIFRREPA
jgi:hypothetical protein